MPPYTTAKGRSRRDDLETAKRQTVFLVALLTTVFMLWPTRYIIVRDALIVLFLAWATAKAFDLAAFIDGAWGNVPYWVKMLVPFDPEIQIPAPFDCIKSASHRSLATARLKLHRLAPVAKYGLEGLMAVVVALLDWFLSQGRLSYLAVIYISLFLTRRLEKITRARAGFGIRPLGRFASGYPSRTRLRPH